MAMIFFIRYFLSVADPVLIHVRIMVAALGACRVTLIPLLSVLPCAFFEHLGATISRWESDMLSFLFDNLRRDYLDKTPSWHVVKKALRYAPGF